MVKYEFVTKAPKLVQIPFWVLVSSRPRQWLKNLALFGPLVFEGEFFNPGKFWLVVAGFVIFSMVTSSIYLINDVIDINKDKAHPFKSKRPIAAGILNPQLAILASIVLLVFALFVASRVSPFFTYATVAYTVLQVVYSLFLRSVILLDVMAIAAGFVLRVYAGVWAIDAHLNVWFLLSISSFALFIAIGKRRSELTLMQAQASKHREILSHYPENLLDILTSMFANSTWLTYAFFAFLQPPILARRALTLFFNDLDLPFAQAKYLMATVPVVIYGVMRYLYVIYEKREGESPERVLLTDKPILIAVLLWLLMVVTIIYYLGV